MTPVKVVYHPDVSGPHRGEPAHQMAPNKTSPASDYDSHYFQYMMRPENTNLGSFRRPPQTVSETAKAL